MSLSLCKREEEISFGIEKTSSPTIIYVEVQLQFKYIKYVRCTLHSKSRIQIEKLGTSGMKVYKTFCYKLQCFGG